MAQPLEPTGIAALGLDAKALLFQVINFLLLLVILRIVAYKPILKILERRRKTIEESLDKARVIEEKETQLQEKTEKILKHAQDKASAIIKDAKTTGVELKTQLVEQGKLQQRQLLDQTAKQIESEKQKMLQEAKKELGYLAIAIAGKVIEEKLDEKTNERFVEKTLKELP